MMTKKIIIFFVLIFLVSCKNPGFIPNFGTGGPGNNGGSSVEKDTDKLIPYIELGLDYDTAKNLYDSDISPLEAKFFLDNDLDFPIGRPLTYTDLGLNDYYSEFLIKDGITPEETLSYFVFGFYVFDVINLVEGKVIPEKAAEFVIFSEGDVHPSIHGAAIVKIIEMKKTMTDINEYLKIGVDPKYIHYVLNTPLDYAKYLISIDVDQDLFDKTSAVYSLEEIKSYYNLIKIGHVLTSLLEEDISKETALNYLNVGVKAESIVTLHFLDIAPDKAKKYIDNKVPSWAIEFFIDENYNPNHYTTNDVKIYLDILYDYYNSLEKQEYYEYGIFVLYDNKINPNLAKEYADAGADIRAIPAFIMEDISPQIVKSYTTIDLSRFLPDEAIIQYHQEGISLEKIRPYYEAKVLRRYIFVSGSDSRPKGQGSKAITSLINNGISIELIEEYHEGASSFGIQSVIRLFNEKIFPHDIKNLNDILEKNYPDVKEKYVGTIEIANALDYGINFEEYKKFINNGGKPAHLTSAIVYEIPFEDITYAINNGYDIDIFIAVFSNGGDFAEYEQFISSGMNIDLYENTRSLDIPLQMVIDYLKEDIPEDKIITLFFNDVSPPIAGEFYSYDIHPAWIHVMINKGLSAKETAEYKKEIGANDFEISILINRNVELDQAKPYASLGADLVDIADFINWNINIDDVEYYTNEGIKNNIPDLFVSGTTTQEISQYLTKEIHIRDIPHFKFFNVKPEDLDQYEADFRFRGTAFSYGFRDLILHRQKNGLIPKDKEPIFTLFGISQIQRYSVAMLASTLRFSDPNFVPNKPIALLVFSSHDESIKTNGPFSVKEDYDSLLDGYDIILFETDNDDIQSFIDFASKYDYPELIIFGAHGAPSIMNFGGSGEEEVNIDLDDRYQYTNIVTQLGSPESIVLLSCSTGLGGEKGENIANMIAEVFNTQVFAPNIPSNIDYFIFNEEGKVERVLFLGYGENHVIYTGRN